MPVLRLNHNKDNFWKEYLQAHEKGLQTFPSAATASTRFCFRLRTLFLRVGQRSLFLFWRDCVGALIFNSALAKRLAATQANRPWFSLSFWINCFVVCRFYVGRIPHHVPLVLRRTYNRLERYFLVATKTLEGLKCAGA